MNNIRFTYLYRDAANYKEYAAVIFSNPNRLSIENVMGQLKESLIDGTFFIPLACNIPLIHSFSFHPELDHEWYELDALEETSEESTDNRSIELFMKDCSDGNFHTK